MREYLEQIREENRREEEERRKEWQKLGAFLTGFAVCLLAAVAIVGWPL